MAFTTDKITGKKLLKPPLKLIGAKTKVRGQLYHYFPEHTTYVEPFMGTAGVLIGKPKSNLEITGDKEWESYNFYKILQERPEDFWDNYWKSYKHMINMGEEHGRIFFEAYKDTLNLSNIPNLELAVAYYFVNKLAMNGIFRRNKTGKVNSSYCQTIKGRGFMDRHWFDLVLERIKEVQFLHEDYSVTIRKQIPGAFTFVDPPYRECKTTYNGVKFTDADHELLKDMLEVHCDKWMLTINDDEWVRGLYKGYNFCSWDVNYSCSQTPSGRGNHPELIITNYDPPNRIKGNGTSLISQEATL